MSEPQELLSRVNQDVLIEIIEVLRRTGGLHELSQTSRRVRAACMPILFRQCFRITQVPLPDPRSFMPHSLWLHVQSLVLQDDCPDRLAFHSLRYTDNRIICGALSEPLLDQGLSGMPRLRSVTIYQRGEEPHGLSWPALRAVMSHPVIREFTLDRLHFCPVLRPSDELHVDSLAPLDTFRYLFRTPERLSFIPESRAPKPNFDDETAALDAVLGALHNTLKVLYLLSEAVPVRAISQRPWPCLRRLVLRGKPSEALFSPVETTRRGVLWLGNAVAAFPCPALEEFVLTYPDPEDQTFAHLPPTLLSLSLCCWRHLYHDFLDTNGSSGLPYGLGFSLLLNSSALRLMLHRAHTPLLVRLTLEYRAGDGDEELLDHISRSYPQLTYLKFIRYRRRNTDEVPVEHIAHALTPLSRLYELKLHLDLPEMPMRGVTLMYGIRGGYSTAELKRFRVVVNETADLFARGLGSSVRFLSILTPTAHPSWWACFEVIHRRAVPKDDYGCSVR
ncbi:hypothetical protein OH76DRAFT_1485588 [Lentinus brumalis]|uniref:F-box domain-containing protein n=1 Tax=Lentinus brumalis TaxID=2498619 RepID=A0A371D1E8_9APHY|nr:hypothetical protein OH76DRAFT_1485588 [Polyporus brumalis]